METEESGPERPEVLHYKTQSRAPRVLLFADGTVTPGRDYLSAFIDAGYDVFHVGIDGMKLDMANFKSVVFYHDSELGRVGGRSRFFKLDSLFDLIGDNWDFIFHVQDWTSPTDIGKSPIPYFYLCTEVMAPIAPRCTWVAHGATVAIMDQLKAKYNTIRTFAYTPHAVMLGDKTFPAGERPIGASFAGEIYKFDDLYKERRETVAYLKKHMREFTAHYMSPPAGGKVRLPESGMGLLGPTAYFDLLANSKVGLNVPTVGGANFRDLEVPSAGAMLVTRHTPDHDNMGFEDGVNCRFYRTNEEALAACRDYDPDIARAGWELVVNGREWEVDGRGFKTLGHTYERRMAELGVIFENVAGIRAPKHRSTRLGGSE